MPKSKRQQRPRQVPATIGYRTAELRPLLEVWRSQNPRLPWSFLLSAGLRRELKPLAAQSSLVFNSGPERGQFQHPDALVIHLAVSRVAQTTALNSSFAGNLLSLLFESVPVKLITAATYIMPNNQLQPIAMED